MDKILDDYIDLGRKEGREDVIRFLYKKKSPEEIADLLEIPVEEVLEIIKE